jgi:centrosomal protein CEP170
LDEARSKSATKAPGLRSEIGEKQDTELQEKESHMEHQGDGQSHTPMEEGGMEGKGKPSSAPSAPRNAPGSAGGRKRWEERKGGGGGAEGGELKSGKPLLRQGSFTIEKPSANVPAELIPHINRGHERSDSTGSMDTATLLKDTEAVMAFLEAKLRDENKLDQKGAKSGGSAKASSAYHASRTGSISPESDVDTASTASQDSNRLSSASEQLSERRHARGRDVSSGRTERGSVARRRSVSRGGSMDLSDDAQGSSLPYSDQEGGSRHHPGRKYTVPLKKEDGGGKGSQALSRSSSLSAPRATRASMLRRARLGDASDNEASETDRLAKEAASKQSKEAKRLTRLDMLAMPRKRTSSFNAPSDTEASVLPPVSSRSTGFSNRLHTILCS